MLDFTAFLVAVGPVAITITKLVDWVRAFDTRDAWWKGWWITAALVFGVIYALITGVNFVALVGGLRPEVSSFLSGTGGEIVTGLAIGAVASAWHEPLSGWGNKNPNPEASSIGTSTPSGSDGV